VGDQFVAGSNMIDQHGIDVKDFQKFHATGSIRTPGRTRSRGAICTLRIAATNNLAQDRIGERRR
jgi:hypothetical protein